MIKILRSLPDVQSLRDYVEKEYGLEFDDFTLYRDIGGAVYLTNTSTQKYVFKLSIAPYSDKAVKSTQVINFLKQNFFSIVSIISTKDEKLFINVEMPEGNRIGTLFEYIEGETATHDDIYEIGKLTGRLHNLLSSYEDELPCVYAKENFVDRLPAESRKTSYNKRKIDELETYGQALWNKVKDEPVGIIHGDLDMGNIIKQDVGVFRILDCDNTAVAPLAYDVASICSRVNYMAVNERDIELTRRTIELFNKGYQEEQNTIFDVEKIINFIAMKRFEAQGQALQRLMPVTGNQNFLRFMDATYQWFVDWKRIFN